MKENLKKYIAEFIGTLVLVLFGCGTAALTGAELVPTALAFGLVIVAMAYAIGDISGCHINPAVSLAMLIKGRLKIADFVAYVISQIAGAFAGSGLLFVILKSANKASSDFGVPNLAANGFSASGLDGISAAGAFLLEVILTFVFVFTIIKVTEKKDNAKNAGLIIGFTLCLVHLFGIKLTGTSVNPARSLAPAVIQGGIALKQVWLFVAAPFVSAIIAAILSNILSDETEKIIKKK